MGSLAGRTCVGLVALRVAGAGVVRGAEDGAERSAEARDGEAETVGAAVGVGLAGAADGVADLDLLAHHVPEHHSDLAAGVPEPDARLRTNMHTLSEQWQEAVFRFLSTPPKPHATPPPNNARL